MSKNTRNLVAGLVLSATLFTSTMSTISVQALTSDEAYTYAFNATMNALSSKTQKSIKDARTAINSLNGTGAAWAIGEFSSKVDSVQQPILVKIVNAIGLAQDNPNQSNINAARNTIEAELPTEWRNSYSSALDLVQQRLMNEATVLYQTADSTKIKNKVNAALNLIQDIKTCNDTNIVDWAKGYETKLNELLKVSDDVISFKDENIENAVRRIIGKKDGVIYSKEVENITSLNLQNYRLRDLSDIENLTKLKSLIIYCYSDTDLTPLKSLNKLENLSIKGENLEISDLDLISNLSNLKSLRLLGCNLTNIRSLSKLTSLQYLSLYSNEISNIEPLSYLTNLKYLNLRSNNVENLSSLKTLTNLSVLDLSYNPASSSSASSLENLATLVNLRKLSLNSYAITKNLENSLPNCEISTLNSIDFDNIFLNEFFGN